MSMCDVSRNLTMKQLKKDENIFRIFFSLVNMQIQFVMVRFIVEWKIDSGEVEAIRPPAALGEKLWCKLFRLPFRQIDCVLTVGSTWLLCNFASNFWAIFALHVPEAKLMDTKKCERRDPKTLLHLLFQLCLIIKISTFHRFNFTCNPQLLLASGNLIFSLNEEGKFKAIWRMSNDVKEQT